MNFIEALNMYSPGRNSFTSLTSTFKEFDDIFGGFPQYGLISVMGRSNSNFNSFALSVISNYVSKCQISNILYLNFRGEIKEQSLIKNLRSIIFDIPYNHLCNYQKWQKEDYEAYDTIVASNILEHKEYLKNLFIESLSDSELELELIRNTIYKYVKEYQIKVVVVDDLSHLVNSSKEYNTKKILCTFNEICSCYHIPIILNVPIENKNQDSVVYHSNLVIDISSCNTKEYDCYEKLEVKVLKNDCGPENDCINLYYNKNTRGIYSIPIT